MKKADLKKVVVCLCAVLLTTALFSSQVQASGNLSPDSGARNYRLCLAENTEISTESPEVDEEIEEVITSYFTGRKSLLDRGDTELFSSLTLSGLADDELKHKNSTETACYSKLFSITRCQSWYEEANLLVTECTEKGTVSHEISLLRKENGEWIVVADKYRNIYDGFTSASYVSPEDIAAIEQMLEAQKKELLSGNRPFNNSLVLLTTFLNIADGEVGYLEKASNYDLNSPTGNPGYADYTKYGKWIGTNGLPWCASFVSWCANQAGISTNIIPCTDTVQGEINSFTNWGRYYSTTNYTPVPGDIFCMKIPDVISHTGIVVSQNNNTILVIDGNAYADGGTYPQVRTKYFSLSDYQLTGYGHPDYCYGNNHSISSVYSSDLYTHWHSCAVCETRFDEASHSWVNQGSFYRCSVCGKQTTVIPGNHD